MAKIKNKAKQNKKTLLGNTKYWWGCATGETADSNKHSKPLLKCSLQKLQIFFQILLYKIKHIFHYITQRESEQNHV